MTREGEAPMVDVVDIALNVGGWIVGGLTALGGILAAHYFQEQSRARQEYRVNIFEPLRREMTNILERRPVVATGLSLWVKSNEFRDIVKRGALNARPLNDLRKDIDRLLELDRAHEKAYFDFYGVRENAMKVAWETYRLKASGMNAPVALTELPYTSTDPLLLQAFVGGDKDGWVRRFNDGVRGQAKQLGQDVEPLAPPERIFDELNVQVEPERKEFRTTAESLLAQAGSILKRLDAALGGKLVYRAT